MDKELHELLLDIDRPCLTENGWMRDEWPENFDYDNARHRAKNVTKTLSKTLAREFNLDDAHTFQDAFFWGEIRDPLDNFSDQGKSLFWIRISSWGNLVATREISPFRPMIKEEIAAVQKVMDENGFRWVDGDVLKNTPYDGVIKGETIPGQPAFSSWWDRFFEYN